MQMRNIAGIAWLAAALSIWPAAAPAQEPADTVLREEARVRLRTVELRVEPVTRADAPTCLALDLDDLKVRVRGQTVQGSHLLDLSRAPRPTIHALLVDSSRSMEGWLTFMRDAMRRYAARLDPAHERAMIVTFDDSVLLAQAATSDRRALLGAIGQVRMSTYTALVDGLYYTALDLEEKRERPVIVLLTDGIDSLSFHDRADVHRIVDRRPDLIVFTIGLNVPFISGSGPPGAVSAKRFLQRLARRTNGRYFDRPVGRGLDEIYAEIRALLESEARLTLLTRTPRPSPAGSASNRGCPAAGSSPTGSDRPPAPTHGIFRSPHPIPQPRCR